MTTYVLCKTLVPWLCSRSQPGIKVSIKGLLGAFVTYCNISCFLLVNVKMPTIVGILTCMDRKNSNIGLPEPEKAEFLGTFYTYEHFKFHAQLR